MRAICFAISFGSLAVALCYLLAFFSLLLPDSLSFAYPVTRFVFSLK